MLSFIIIGKNIENTVELCINSINQFIKENSIEKYEIIYVDSDSKDKSIDIAKNYSIQVLQISGNVNAAIARNSGAKFSNGEVLFFIDGDMEILPEFYNNIFFSNSIELKYPFVNGYWEDRFYDKEFNYLRSRSVKLPKKSRFIPTTGGLIIIKKELWERVNGMDERLIRSQDHDLGFRLTKIGYPAKRYNQLFAIHHTVSYFDKKRFIYFIFSKALFSQGLLMRKHLFNITYLKSYKKSIIYVLLLILSSFLLIFNSQLGFIALIIYFSLHFIRVIKNYSNASSFFLSLLYKLLQPFYALIAFIFYYPNKPKYKFVIFDE